VRFTAAVVHATCTIQQFDQPPFEGQETLFDPAAPFPNELPYERVVEGACTSDSVIDGLYAVSWSVSSN